MTLSLPRAPRLGLTFLLVLLTEGQIARAQDCGCDHTVAPETLSINGADMGVLAGETVCITAGPREFLRVYEMVGTEDAPIVIKNCGGVVEIDNADRGYGLTLEGSSFVQLTGTGTEGVTYGFRVRAEREGPDYSASCIIASGFSTDYELDHIEAYDCGFAGVSAKTDPNCEQKDVSSFVQRNSRLHHLYLHDTKGEGIYFGNTGYPSREGTCDGQTVDLIPHTHEGVYIHDNIIEDTGWDGAQIGVSPKDCFFFRNRISRVGQSQVEYQMQGLQIGGGSACEIYDNFIAHGPAVGIIVLDAADTFIYNNVVYDFVDGIYLNDRDSEVTEGARYRVVHNTVVETSERGITAYGERSANNAFINNLIVASPGSPLGIGAEVDHEEAGNLIFEGLSEAGFVSVEEEDFRLEEGASAVDSGVDSTAFGVTTDQLGALRDASPDVGAFEYGAEVPDGAPPLPEPGDNPSEGGDGDGGSDGGDGDGDGGDADGGDGDSGSESGDSEAGGCSCRNARPAPSGSLAGLSLLGLWVFAWARRKRALSVSDKS